MNCPHCERPMGTASITYSIEDRREWYFCPLCNYRELEVRPPPTDVTGNPL